MDFDYLEQLLVGYGLTENQTKVFSTLVKNDRALTVKQISSISDLAKESVYRNLLALKKINLVEYTIEFPKRYVAIPIKSALLFLHEQKCMQIRELEVLTTQVLVNYDKQRNKTDIKEETQFLLIPKKKRLNSRISDAISKSKKNIKIITSWKRQLRAMIVYESAINKALNNGVKIQFLLTETLKDSKLPKYADVLRNNPNTVFKFLKSSTKVIAIIIDNKEIIFMTDPKAGLLDSPALWSNNPSLIIVLTNYFNSIWKNAK